MIFFAALMASLGLNLIVVEGTIFVPVIDFFLRGKSSDSFYFSYVSGFFFELLTCLQCFGFWAGIFISTFLEINGADILTGVSFIATVLVTGFCSSLLGVLINEIR